MYSNNSYPPQSPNDQFDFVVQQQNQYSMSFNLDEIHQHSINNGIHNNLMNHSPISSHSDDMNIPNNNNNKGQEQDRTEKIKSRRNNQNIASRNYRQRKKVYIKEMEDKINQLTLENDSLKQNLFKVGGNPTDMLKISEDAIFYIAQMRRLVVQMDTALRNNEPDSTLKFLLTQWNQFSERGIYVNEKEIEAFVHPYTQAKLALIGYKPSGNPWTEFVNDPNRSEWWKLYVDRVKLTPEQMEQIIAVWKKFKEDQVVVRKELDNLDEIIKRFCVHKIFTMPDCDKLLELLSQPVINIQESLESDIIDSTEVLAFICNLEKLKQKFTKMHRLLFDTSKQIAKFLTVRQETLLMVTVHSNTKYIHSNMEMASNLWNQINRTNIKTLLNISNINSNDNFDMNNNTQSNNITTNNSNNLEASNNISSKKSKSKYKHINSNNTSTTTTPIISSTMNQQVPEPKDFIYHNSTIHNYSKPKPTSFTNVNSVAESINNHLVSTVINPIKFNQPNITPVPNNINMNNNINNNNTNNNNSTNNGQEFHFHYYHPVN